MQKGAVTADAIAELADLAINEASGAETDAKPLTEGDVPSGDAANATVSLTAVAQLRNVNALADGSRLEFAPHGLTLVYGDNGSGKSGYVRVLKKLVRARAPAAQLRPNVFHEALAETSATLEYRVGEVAKSASWQAGASGPSELSAVTVFDRDCAAVYVNRENEVAYRPFGLDLLDTLAHAVESVKAELQQRKYKLRASFSSPPEEIVPNLRAQQLWPLSSSSDMKAIAKVTWSVTRSKELDAVQRALAADDPVARGSGLRSVANTYRRAGARCVAVAEALGRASADAVRGATKQHQVASQAQAQIATRANASSDLQGIGGDAWLTLWEAARRYSLESAYPQHAFPHVKPGAQCVLCGQQLAEFASQRLLTLEEFVASETGKLAAAAKAELSSLRDELRAVATGAQTDQAVVDDLRLSDSERAAATEAYLGSARALAAEILKAEREEDWARLSELAPSPTASLMKAAEQCETQAVMAAKAADPVAAASLRSRRDELTSNRWLATNRSGILREVERQRQLRRLNQALSSCSTNAITAASSELTERYVTRKFKSDLREELARLGASRLPITVTRRGLRGSTLQRMELLGATGGVRVDEVVSEGEFGALALAAYLAELNQGGPGSAIVLDDPVSSLDHERRSRVADRLVDEAKSRQVIVFTHDLVFLYDLEHAAEKREVAITVGRLQRTAVSAGIPEQGPPWHAQKVKTRVGTLEAELARASRTHSDGDQATYESMAERWYRRLRDTWERAVEEVLLADVVIRLRPDVRTQSALSGKVWLIEEEDIRTLDRAMSRVSAQLHDQPQAVNRPVPQPDELATDLEDLRLWVERIKARR